MSETVTRHSQLKYRLRTRIPEELFDAMPENVQDFLLHIAQEDIREGQLTTILNLPWQSRGVLPPVNLALAKTTLDRSHYAMTGVKEKVLRFIACQKHLNSNYGAVLLLVGAPGVGKTSIAVSIARAMGRPCVKISLAGVADALYLRGVQQVFQNARPGRIVEAIIRGKSFCPVILLDEIDKMGNSREHGSPENVLLDLLDSDRALFVDNYLNFPLDLSNAIFIATANSLEPLSPVLKDRMDIVELPSYTPHDKTRILQGYIWPKLVQEFHLDALDKLHQPENEDEIFICTKGLELTDDAAHELIRLCTEDGVRDLERICRSLCEAVIGIYYAQGILYTKVDKAALPVLLGPVFYPK